jgi:competence ComEA-like helix-hairpin-helix protein
MPSTFSNQQVDFQQKKDDRLIILLGIGIFLLFIYCFQQLNILPILCRNDLKLQCKGSRIVIDGTGPSPLQETAGDPVHDASIPAALTPFFFAPLPINEADQELLETVSGIGPHLAAEIIKTRSQRGPFHSPEDLLHIRGIGTKRMFKFADQFSYR